MADALTSQPPSLGVYTLTARKGNEKERTVGCRIN